MITQISIQNFRKLDNITFQAGRSVVLIGPNNSGKSTVLQALCLWEIGVVKFLSAAQTKSLNKTGSVTINRRDLLNSPIADARFLWRNKKVTELFNGSTRHVKLAVELKGEEAGTEWECKAEFEFSNNESLVCRLVSGQQKITELYYHKKGIRFGFLQPMSGLSSDEDLLAPGSVERRLGEGKTAEVLRNICFLALYPENPEHDANVATRNWEHLCIVLKSLFGVQLQKPEFIKASGIIELKYTENGIQFDISAAGRGLQQTLLLLAYMYANPRTVLLLDEPDAHLEVIRQREVFRVLTDTAEKAGVQVIIASHSEVVLTEAAETSTVIALVENTVFELNPDNKTEGLKHLKRALTEIGWEKYALARLKGHVLYLEGSTDLQMLLSFAEKLKHKALPLLRTANVDYTSNNIPATAINKFTSLQALFPGLRGLALFDHKPNLQNNPKLPVICWERRELENYFARPQVLCRFAESLAPETGQERQVLKSAMEESIKEYTAPIHLKNTESDWWHDEKLTDNWLEIIFPAFYSRIGGAKNLYKSNYHRLIGYLNPDEIPAEITEKLDRILALLQN